VGDVIHRVTYPAGVVSMQIILTREQALRLGYFVREGFPQGEIVLTLEVDVNGNEFREMMRRALTSKGGRSKAGPLQLRRGGRHG
jgi:hypothetical protein